MTHTIQNFSYAINFLFVACERSQKVIGFVWTHNHRWKRRWARSAIKEASVHRSFITEIVSSYEYAALSFKFVHGYTRDIYLLVEIVHIPFVLL